MTRFARLALSLSALLAATTAATRVAGGPRPIISAADVVVVEGQTAEIVLILSEPSVDPIVADYQTSGRSADEDVDFAGGSGPVIFFPGETVKTILVPTYEDGSFEKDEIFTIRVRSSGANTPGGPIRVTIVN